MYGGEAGEEQGVLEVRGRGRHSELEADSLAVVCGVGVWQMCSVSALYNMQYSTTRLKQYAAQIKRLLSTMEARNPVKYRVEFMVDPNLKKNPDDPHALMIEVHIKDMSESGKENLAYSAILMSWGKYSEVPNAIHLPFLLEHGQQRIGGIVKTMLTKIFDCSIAPITFTPNHLLQFLIAYSQSETSDIHKTVELHYKLEKAPSKHKISIKFEINDILNTWSRVCSEQDEETKIEDIVDMTYGVLQHQLYYSVKIDMSMLQLTEISHPKGNVKINGVIRMKSPDIARSTFPVLNDFVIISKH